MLQTQDLSESRNTSQSKKTGNRAQPLLTEKWSAGAMGNFFVWWLVAWTLCPDCPTTSSYLLQLGCNFKDLSGKTCESRKIMFLQTGLIRSGPSGRVSQAATRPQPIAQGTAAGDTHRPSAFARVLGRKSFCWKGQQGHHAAWDIQRMGALPLWMFFAHGGWGLSDVALALQRDATGGNDAAVRLSRNEGTFGSPVFSWAI